MGYVLGVSSGMFYTASQEEKVQFMTIPRKIFRGGLEGVNFTQIDIESITEFKEPDLEKEVEKIKKIGIRFGVHGESYAMGGTEKPISMLDSAVETEYIHAHQRLIEHVNGCGRIKAEYVNVHPSETVPFIRLGMHLEPTKLVDFWGRPLRKFIEENPDLLEWIIKTNYLWEFTRRTPATLIESEKYELKQYYFSSTGKKESELSEEEIKKIEETAIERVKNIFLHEIDVSELAYGPEKVAYYIIAKWMQDNNDPLWKSIVGKHINEKDFPDVKNIQKWVPAVSAKYIWGHFCPKEKDRYPDPRPLLEKYRLFFVFETQMGSGGIEGMYRIVRVRDMIFLSQAIGSKWVGVCFDMEHLLTQNINPKEEVESITYGSAKFVKVCHLGFPTPHATAHMPIPLGSKEQLYVYDRLFDLRKKGFKDGYLIFERGSNPREEVVIVMRLIKEFLEKDTPSKELPLEFFGMKPEGPEIRRQELAIREHFLDPLRGMLIVPEEEYTFLSSEAIRKGKGEEWKKEKYR
jgi:hypothetical protein